MSDLLLAVNAGSSSIKFAAFSAADGVVMDQQLKGRMEGIGLRPRLVASDVSGALLIDRPYSVEEVGDHDGAIAAISGWVQTRPERGTLVAAGHRVAHGGSRFTAPALIDDDLLDELDRLAPLAPLHQPANLAGIRALRARNPSLPQVACFDTAFHRQRSEIADRFALPERFYREGVRRYGFHGLSYDYIARRLPSVAPEVAAGKVVVAHLGSGASMCGMIGGRSVDTTMSFSALDGLPMGTRCGALDPGVMIYLFREIGMSASEVETMLYTECGLRGLSGISSDMRDLERNEQPSAKMAVEYYVYHVCRHFGALAAAMNGIDAVVFTAGIGEKSALIRKKICSRLAWLGVHLDDAANEGSGPCITTDSSLVSAWVVATDEEAVIADYTADVLRTVQHGDRR